jgi:alpha-L-fucosidase
MITFNLQTACEPCGHPNATAQRCQAFGCLPVWPRLQSWALKDLNVSAWLAASASFGARYAVLVADHMSGFTLWPTKVHPVSIASTAFRGGRGDVVAEFRAAAAIQGIAAGFFYSVRFNAKHPAHQKPTPPKSKPEPKPYHPLNPNQTDPL